jgi:hypothetical protein
MTIMMKEERGGDSMAVHEPRAYWLTMGLFEFTCMKPKLHEKVGAKGDIKGLFFYFTNVYIQ